MFVQKLSGFTDIFMGCLNDSQTKDLRLRSPFFDLQEKYFSLEFSNLILSQETKELSSGKIILFARGPRTPYGMGPDIIRLVFFLVSYLDYGCYHGNITSNDR